MNVKHSFLICAITGLAALGTVFVLRSRDSGELNSQTSLQERQLRDCEFNRREIIRLEEQRKLVEVLVETLGFPHLEKWQREIGVEIAERKGLYAGGGLRLIQGKDPMAGRAQSAR